MTAALCCRCRALIASDFSCGWAVGDLRRCPLAVASELGIFLLTIAVVRRGYCCGPLMYPCATARMKVVGGVCQEQHGRIARDRDLIAVVSGAAAVLGL
jgi:hypothetical protein